MAEEEQEQQSGASGGGFRGELADGVGEYQNLAELTALANNIPEPMDALPPRVFDDLNFDWQLNMSPAAVSAQTFDAVLGNVRELNQIAPYDFTFEPQNVQLAGFIWEETQQDFQAAMEQLNNFGLTHDMVDAEGNLRTNFFVQTELWSLSSGLTKEYIDMWEAERALQTQTIQALEELRNNMMYNSYRMARDPLYLEFDKQYIQTGKVKPEVWNTVAANLDRVMSEEGWHAIYGRAALMLDERPELMRTEQGRAWFVWDLLSLNTSLAHEYRVDQGYIDAPPGPGLGDAFGAIGRGFLGLVDVLPEERLGFDVEGSITGAVTTPLAGVFQADALSGVMPPLMEAFDMLDRNTVQKLGDAINYVFAEGMPGWVAAPFKANLLGVGEINLGMNWGQRQGNPWRAHITSGQNIATWMGLPPGSDWWNNVSGAWDGAEYIVADPLTYLVPYAKGVSLSRRVAADAMRLSSKAARARTVAQAVTPWWGRETYLGWKGMKGPLTRAFYWTHAKTAEQLRNTPDAIRMWEEMGRYLMNDDIAGLRAAFPQVVDNPHYLLALEGAVDEYRHAYKTWSQGGIDPWDVEVVQGGRQGDSAQVVPLRDAVAQQVGDVWEWFASGADDLNHPVGARVQAMIEDAELNMRHEIWDGLENGTVGARDVIKWGTGGDHPVRPINQIDGSYRLVWNERDNVYRHVRAQRAEGEKVYIFHGGKPKLLRVQDIKRMTEPELRNLYANHPQLAVLLDDVRQYGAEEAVRLSSGTRLKVGNALRDQVLDSLEDLGFEGINVGGYIFLTDMADLRRIETLDVATGKLPDILDGHYGQRWLSLAEEGSRFMRNPAVLDWVHTLPKRTTETRQLLRAVSEKFADQRWDPVRRFGQRFARINDKEFPVSIDLFNTQVGMRQIRQIGARMGLPPNEIERWVQTYRNAPRHLRFYRMKEFRKHMLARAGAWQMQEGLAGGALLDEDAAQYGGLAYGPNVTRSGEGFVEVAHVPSLRVRHLPMFNASFYEELRRLDFIRSKRGRIVPRRGFVGTQAHKTRKQLVERFKKYLKEENNVHILDEMGLNDDDVYNMAFATIYGEDANALGMISRISRQMNTFHKAFMSQFSLTALGLNPFRWLMKVVMIEEPIRAGIDGIPSIYTNPYSAFMGVLHGHWARKADELIDDMPNIRRAAAVEMMAAMDEIWGAAGPDSIAKVRAFVAEFGDEFLEFMPDGVMDEIAQYAEDLKKPPKYEEIHPAVKELLELDREEFLRRYQSIDRLDFIDETPSSYERSKERWARQIRQQYGADALNEDNVYVLGHAGGGGYVSYVVWTQGELQVVLSMGIGPGGQLTGGGFNMTGRRPRRIREGMNPSDQRPKEWDEQGLMPRDDQATAKLWMRLHMDFPDFDATDLAMIIDPALTTRLSAGMPLAYPPKSGLSHLIEFLQNPRNNFTPTDEIVEIYRRYDWDNLDTTDQAAVREMWDNMSDVDRDTFSDWTTDAVYGYGVRPDLEVPWDVQDEYIQIVGPSGDFVPYRTPGGRVNVPQAGGGETMSPYGASTAQKTLAQVQAVKGSKGGRRLVEGSEPTYPNVTYQMVQNAVQGVVGRYLDDFAWDLGGRVSLSTEVQKQMRMLSRVFKPPKWSLPSKYGVEDLEMIGRSPDGTDIYSKLILDEAVRIPNDAYQMPVSYYRSRIMRKKYARAYASDITREINDTWFRVATQRMLDDINGVQSEPLTQIIQRTDWRSMRDNVERIFEWKTGADARGLSDLDLATWYFDGFPPEASWSEIAGPGFLRGIVEYKLQQLWTDKDGTIDIARRRRVLEEVMERKLLLPNDKTIDVRRSASVTDTEHDLRVWFTDEDALGNTLEFLPRDVVGTFYPLENFDDPRLNQKKRFYEKPNDILRRVVQAMGPSASETMNRVPAWRRLYNDYRRHYESLGWSKDRAKAAAQMKATTQVNALMYDIDSMANWRVKFNRIIPFGAAMVEVAEVWWKNLPRDSIGNGGMSGWLLGTTALARRYQRVTQALETIGLLQRDEDGRLTLVAERDAQLNNQLGEALSRGFNDILNAPSHFAHMITKVIPQVDEDMFAPFERISFPIGSPIASPFNTENQGLFAMSSFGIGLGPHIAWPAHAGLAWAGVFGKKDEYTVEEGQKLQDVLAEMDITLSALLTDADNRIALTEAGFDLDQAAADLTIFEIARNPELPAGLKLVAPHSGWMASVISDYVFPYGAPESASQALGAYLPGSLQWLARATERTFHQGYDPETDYSGKDGNTPWTDWFFGPEAVYRSDAVMAQAMMLNNARTHNIDKWAQTQIQISEIRGSLVEDGLARLFDVDHQDPRNIKFERLEPISPDQDPRWNQILKLESLAGDLEHSIIEDAANTAAAFDFVKGMTLMLSPTSPRLMRQENIQLGELWQSVELGEAIRKGEGPVAFDEWKRNIDPRRWDEMASVVLHFLAGHPEDKYGFTSPSISDAKKEFDRQFPTLSAYLTPSKIYSDSFVDTETVQEFFEAVKEGRIRFADPEVYMMRHYNQRLSWQQGAERRIFLDRANESGNPIKYTLENWDEWMSLSTNHKVERDYLNVVDQMEFDGKWGDALDKLREERDAATKAGGKWTPEGTFSEEEQIWREDRFNQLLLEQETVNALIEDLDQYNIDPTRIDEVRRGLYALDSAIQQMVDSSEELERYGARSPEEAMISEYFRVIYRPYTTTLTNLYAAAFASTNQRERAIAFDTVRQFQNEKFWSSPTVRGYPVPNAPEWQQSLKTEEQLRTKAYKVIGTKVDWITAQDVDTLMRVASPELVERVLPTSPQEWLLYTIRNKKYNEIEAGRRSNLLTQGQANKLRDAVDKKFNEALMLADRQDEVIFQQNTPAQQLQMLGMLPESLLKPLGVANQFKEVLAAAGKTGSDSLWFGTYWPAIEALLQQEPGALEDFEMLIREMYGETMWLDGAQKLFLGNFGPV